MDVYKQCVVQITEFLEYVDEGMLSDILRDVTRGRYAKAIKSGDKAELDRLSAELGQRLLGSITTKLRAADAEGGDKALLREGHRLVSQLSALFSSIAEVMEQFILEDSSPG